MAVSFFKRLNVIYSFIDYTNKNKYNCTYKVRLFLISIFFLKILFHYFVVKTLCILYVIID